MRSQVLAVYWDCYVPEVVLNITYLEDGADGGNSYGTESVNKGEEYTILGGYTLYKEYYDFVGWSTTPNGSLEYEEGQVIIAESDLTLYPVFVFDQTEYRVIYEGGSATGGTPPVDSNVYQAGETFIVLDEGTLVKEGSEFGGWTSGATGSIFFPGDTGRILGTNAVFTANWSSIVTPPIKQVAVGSTHVLFLLEDGTVMSAGNNGAGQLGRIVPNGTATSYNLGFIESLSDVVFIAAGGAQSFFVRSDGTVWSCGSNTYGGLGRNVANGSTSSSNLGRITTLSGVKEVSAGNYCTHFLLTNGQVWNCGRNINGSLGRIAVSASATSTNLARVTTLSGVKKVIAGNIHSAFLLENGQLWNCGNNNYYNLGRTTANASETTSNLARVTSISNAVDAAIQGHGSAVVLSDGRILTTGANEFGQTGRSITQNSNAFTAIPSVSDAIAVINTSGLGDLYYMTSDGTVYTAGSNQYGRMGRAVSSGSLNRTNLGPISALPKNPISIDVRGTTAYFIYADGEAWSCGYEGYGVLLRLDVGEPLTPNLGISIAGTDTLLKAAQRRQLRESGE